MISPRTENLSESFEEWNNRSILEDNDTKLYFFTIYNIVSPPQSLRDVSPRFTKVSCFSGGIEGGRAPFCWKSKNQEVFGVSLVTFFTQESYRGVERVAPQRNGLAETSL